MDDRHPISRLTEREKICLRQWLQHKSAKEIAADLGISHHAVEKRLKMARTKLGATSSLNAARMLSETEGYGQTVTRSPDLAAEATSPHSAPDRKTVIGVLIMIVVGAIMFGLLSHPAALSQAAFNRPAAGVSAPASTPAPGSETALRTLVAGLASGSPDYGKLSPQFADVVLKDLPTTHPLFSSMGPLKSMSFRGKGAMGDDVYDLTFAKGSATMSATLDADGRMAGGMLRVTQAPTERNSAPSAGTEAALRTLVAGLANGSPDYDKLAPPFADIVRRDLPLTHPMFQSFGELKSITYRGRGTVGDDTYDLAFAKGAVTMSAKLDAQGRMAGGILQPMQTPGK